MKLIGRVNLITPDWVHVSLEQPGSCESCGGCGGMVTEGQKQRAREIQARPGDEPLQVGDLVEVAAAPGTGSLAAVLLFGLPLIGFFAGLLLLPTWLRAWGFPQGEGWSLLSAFGTLGLSLFLVGCLTRLGLFRSLALKVMHRIPPDQVPEFTTCSMSEKMP